MRGMTTTAADTRRRGRSEKKRLAILDAAQELFVGEGFERTSVDAIAARADVSKRTVYDHFGDKEGIHAAVVERVVSKLLVTVRTALEEELPPGCDLRAGLLSFARRVATEAFPSSEYVQFRNLSTRGAARRRVAGSMRNAPKELFTQRIEDFVAEGAIQTDHPRRAAEHFIALTFLLAQDTLDPTMTGAWDAVDQILVDGVDAFIRAYT
jgi:TetR/AcrR family transcriptional regulator, mexJK operon transcriptional repressor